MQRIKSLMTWQLSGDSPNYPAGFPLSKLPIIREDGLGREGLKSPPESLSDVGAIESLRVPGKEEFRELREQPSDPQAEQELINSIEQKLPPVLNLQELEEYRDKLKQQQAAQRTDVRLSEMLEEEDYPGAIQLCLECQKAASTFKHYSCIRGF
ncbi:hypothetical protein EI555_006903 [Monodon monoceros]|uniref:Vacuolar protein sorting-associated protein 54 N-terminal domain-containing protein n=1 Tax=Monodon monoceros TaxID=40151 RepID=A0A4U1F9S9_MONMO|nr:hypothetical protein EI555_006903 [Monodon monoceros]